MRSLQAQEVDKFTRIGRCLPWIEESVDDFVSANENITCVLDEKVFVLAVDRPHGYQARCAFPNGYFSCDLKDALHNSLRTLAARTRAGYGVVFLANSRAVGCKKRLVAHPDPRYHSLARVTQSVLNPFETYVLAQHIQEQFGYVLVGIGASRLAFLAGEKLDD